MSRKEGQAAESACETYLISQGLRIVSRNYHCRWGEIDLIMQDTDELAFVEVRLRQNLRYGSGAMSVNHNKQQKIIKTALHFLNCHSKNNVNVRFDVVSCRRSQDNTYDFEWVRDAFRAD